MRRERALISALYVRWIGHSGRRSLGWDGHSHQACVSAMRGTIG